ARTGGRGCRPRAGAAALRFEFPPQLRWGGVREADGGVMGVEEDDDPSGPYGPPPQLRWGGNPLPNENGAPQGPVLRLRSYGSDGHVLLRHHAIQHADREHGVEAAGVERGLGGRGLLLGRRLDEAQDLLLGRPDDEPHVEG